MDCGLNQLTLNKITHVFSTFDAIEKAVLYGSRAKGNFHNGSDIDICLLGDIELSMLHTIELALDDLLLPYSFDLCVYNQLKNNELIEHINRVGITFYVQ